MPFPLAHPAAVLPLRRFCPRYLSFSALFIGSIVPDLAYVIDDLNRFSKTVLFLFGESMRDSRYVREDWEWSTFSHTLFGSAIFCLPLAILLLLVFFRLRRPLAASLPQPHREALLPLCGERRESVQACFAALVIGIVLHLVWDSFTHGDGWFLRNSNLLAGTAFTIGGHAISHLRMLWFFSSAGGMLALSVAYIVFLRKKNLPLWTFSRTEGRFYSFWGIMLSIPLPFAFIITDYLIRIERSSWHNSWYVVHVFSEYYLMILGLLLIVTGSFLKGKASRKSD